MNIAQALVRSQSHTEIVHCADTRAEIDALCADAEGSEDLVSQYGYVDIWGTDDDGVEYRLHVTPETPTLLTDEADEAAEPETYEEAAALFRAEFGRDPDDDDGDRGQLWSHVCAARSATNGEAS